MRRDRHPVAFTNAREPAMNRNFPDLAPPYAGYGMGLAILLTAALLIGFFVGLSVAAWSVVG
jgi:hypothetical protein